MSAHAYSSHQLNNYMIGRRSLLCLTLGRSLLCWTDLPHLYQDLRLVSRFFCPPSVFPVFRQPMYCIRSDAWWVECSSAFILHSSVLQIFLTIFLDFCRFLSIFGRPDRFFGEAATPGQTHLYIVRTFIGQCLFDPCFWSSQRPLNLSTALKVMPDLLSILLDLLFILPFFCCFYDFWWFSGASGKSLRMFGVAVVSPGPGQYETVAPTPIMLKLERDVGR